MLTRLFCLFTQWALHRGGAIFLENTEKVHIDSCGFRDLGGNAVFLSGYTRNISVSNSTFAYIGENAMAAWGYTRDLTNRTVMLYMCV